MGNLNCHILNAGMSAYTPTTDIENQLLPWCFWIIIIDLHCKKNKKVKLVFIYEKNGLLEVIPGGIIKYISCMPGHHTESDKKLWHSFDPLCPGFIIFIIILGNF